METTDTKAMSLQECVDKVCKKDEGYPDYRGIPWEQVAELYKNSCLAAQKAELEKSITQEKAKSFDEGATAERNYTWEYYGALIEDHSGNSKEDFSLPPNPYRQDK